MIIALAGRRIDKPDADATRFPVTNVELVRGRLQKLFSETRATVLVCSAACGADLLALAVARDLGIRRRVVLPYDLDQFRETSVVDRPGNWRTLYDQICSEVAVRGDLVVLDCSVDDEAAYAAASNAILDEASDLQTSGKDNDPILAVIVWEGAPRGEDDETSAFAKAAESRGLKMEEILTL